MIKKIRIRGFKKFAEQEFEIPSRLVVTGPNNSGKTSLLQAVGAWMEVAFRWSQNNPDLAREGDDNYPAVNITVDSFSSVPLADFDHLWTGKKTNEPLAIWLETDGWDIGFEFWRKEMELIAVRPAREVEESDLDVLKDDLDDSPERSGRSWRPVYIPPVSGVQVQERQLARQEAILGHLARGEAGRVLRNLLWWARQNGHWDDLKNVVDTFFGYELMTFNPEGEYLTAPYRHSSEEAASYDLSSAASGVLQVLLIYAAIFGRPSAVYLMDEPDAHLHISLQNMLFRDLLKRAQRDEFQIIAATHSERLIREAPEDSLHLLDARGNLKKIPGGEAVATLKLDPVEIAEVLREPRLLYLEGATDIKFLRSWAKTLKHPCLSFMERVTPKTTAEKEDKKHFAVRHLSAMQKLVPEVRGVELLDGDKRDGDREMPEGLELLLWKRKEIESYLLHPDSVERYLRSEILRKDPKDAQKERQYKKAIKYMEDNLPQRFLRGPFGESSFLFLEKLEIKKFFSHLFQEAGLPEPGNEDFLRMAEQMEAGEIHPEVGEKLDQVAKHLDLPEKEPQVGEHGGSAT